MSVAKVVEVSASSSKDFTDAIQAGIDRAADTVENIKSAWVNEMSVTVENGKVKEYRVNMKVTFILK
jgi:flavin-binding protein dodecin